MPTKDCRSALEAAMAASTAHGISHAATTQKTPLKIMWALLFVVFLGFFFSSSSHLVEKLWNRALDKSFELDKVPFVFPDLYLCPSDPYSGSFPYNLTKEEADLVNSEISRIIDRCYNMSVCEKGSPSKKSAYLLAYAILNALPVSVSTKYLTHRIEQSVLLATIRMPVESLEKKMVKLETFAHPQKILCFKLALTDEMRGYLKRKGSYLQLWLSTDPQFSNFEYPGFPIMNLDIGGGKSMNWFEWHSRATSGLLKMSGYSMLVVPPGVYPASEHEHVVHLAPGNHYHLKINMEENTFGDSLVGTKCLPNHPKVAIRDHLTFNRVEFNYSYGYCYLNELTKFSVNSLGLHLPVLVPWSLKNIPRFQNLTEMTESLYKQTLKKYMEFWDKLSDEETRISRYCRNEQPCQCTHYSSDFSFEKWPSVGSAAEGILDFLEKNTELTGVNAPALMKMQKSAKLAMARNHSSHVESVFRSYVSESLLSVKISASSSMAALVTTDWSYSFTSFLADTGGVLGLYIGCSMLTLFEVVEIFWTMCEGICCRSRRQPSENGDREAAGETEAAL